MITQKNTEKFMEMFLPKVKNSKVIAWMSNLDTDIAENTESHFVIDIIGNSIFMEIGEKLKLEKIMEGYTIIIDGDESNLKYAVSEAVNCKTHYFSEVEKAVNMAMDIIIETKSYHWRNMII